MAKFVEKFTYLLQYVSYIEEEKAKVQHFLNFLPIPYKEMIEFDNLKTMDEAARKAILCYELFKNRREFQNHGKERIEIRLEWGQIDRNQNILNFLEITITRINSTRRMQISQHSLRLGPNGWN